MRLRIWREADGPRIAEILERSGDAFDDWLPSLVKELADIPAFVRHVAGGLESQSAFFYAIEAEGEVVGQVSLDVRSSGRGEVGYWLCSDETGSGFATHAVMAVSKAAFQDGLLELVIHCDEGNHRSASVARQAGFTHVGTEELDPNLPRTEAQTGREMTWVLCR